MPECARLEWTRRGSSARHRSGNPLTDSADRAANVEASAWTASPLMKVARGASREHVDELAAHFDQNEVLLRNRRAQESHG